MPSKTIPMIGPPTRRLGGSSSNDEKFINCVFSTVVDPVTQSKSVYLSKRNGIESYITPASGFLGDGCFFSPSTGETFSVFRDGSTSNYYVYDNTTQVGTFSGPSPATWHVGECILNGVTFILFATSAGYFFCPTSYITSFTGDTHTNTTIDNISDTSKLYIGQAISGTGIAAGTRIASIVSGTSITTTLATTATNSGVTITVTPLAKIISANFPSTASGQMVEMDGFIFVGASDGYLYNSDINTIWNWSASSKIAASYSTDGGVGAFKYKRRIGYFGTNSLEFFRNAGNAFGSPLISDDAVTGIGCAGGSAINVPASLVAKRDKVFWLTPSGILYTMADTASKLSYPEAVLRDSYTTAYLFNYRGLDVISIFDGTSKSNWYFVDSNLFSETSFSRIYIDSNAYTGSDVTVCNTIDNTSGKIFRLAVSGSNVFQDNGSSYTMTAQGQPIYLNGGKPFRVKWVDLLADTQSSGSAAFSVSGDDYGSFQSIGNFDLTSNRKRLYRVGYFKSHIIPKLTDSGNNPFRGQGYVFEWEPCQ